MSLHFHWFLPTYGDSRNLMAGGHGSNMSGDRPADLRYLNQLAGAAEVNGFEAVLTPTGLWCEDAWLSTAMLLETTDTLKFLVALRPGLTSPTLAAQMAVDVSVAVERPSAPQRGHRRRIVRATGVRRLLVQGGAIRALRRVPRHHPATLDPGRCRRLRRPPSPRRGCAAGPQAGSAASGVLRRLIARSRHRCRRSTPTPI